MLSPNSNDFFSCNKDLRICNDKSFATIKVVAKNIRLWQSRKSLKLLAAVVTATTKVVVKNIFSNKNLFLATTLVVVKNGTQVLVRHGLFERAFLIRWSKKVNIE